MNDEKPVSSSQMYVYWLHFLNFLEWGQQGYIRVSVCGVLVRLGYVLAYLTFPTDLNRSLLYQESILPNYNLCKTDIFPFFAIKLGCFIVLALFFMSKTLKINNRNRKTEEYWYDWLLGPILWNFKRSFRRLNPLNWLSYAPK